MARLGPFAADRRVVAGVSGGADSMALAVLLARWGRPLACVVDHGLRPESAGEAGLAAAWLGRIGVPATVAAAGLRPGAAMAERAREARYRLLGAECRRVGCPDLLLAHHAQDQAETVALREASGSGPLGLAGMGAVSYRDDVRLLRPFLSLEPGRLRATLRQAGISWIEDPSNQNLNFPRARMRAVFTAGEIARRCGTAEEHATARTQREQDIAHELALAATVFPAGYAHLRQPVSAAALSALIWTLSGRAYPPPSRSVAALAAALHPASLHGVVLLPAGRQDAGWLLGREAAAMAPPVPAWPGARWDGRFTILDAAGEGVTLGPLGPDSARLRSWSDLPSALLQTLPALRTGGELHCVPHLDFPDPALCRSVSLAFGPARPAAGAPFGPA